MRVLIVTSLGKVDIGGPALYADNLPKHLLYEAGVDSTVLRLSGGSKPIRKIFCLFKLFFYVPRYSIIYSLSGSPAINIAILFCSRVFRKKFVIRPGGDFLWERDIERGGTEKPLKEYYYSGDYKRNRLSLFLFSLPLRHAYKIIFPTAYLKSLYINYFNLNESQCEFVDYPFPEIPQDIYGVKKKTCKQFIFAGRLIKFKNLHRLIRAFRDIGNRRNATLKIIGEGPEKQALQLLTKNLGAERYVYFQDRVSHKDLLNEVSGSYCAIVPSIFEPGSFFMLECLKLGIPVIFTKESGLYDVYADTLLFVNPHSVSDIKGKIEFLLSEDHYDNYLKKIEKINTERGWGNVAREHINILQKHER